jgi:RNA recognition motif-containing protein
LQVDAMKNIYIGNLNFQTTQAELRELFKPYGTLSAS